jgi:hypothetical protein
MVEAEAHEGARPAPGKSRGAREQGRRWTLGQGRRLQIRRRAPRGEEDPRPAPRGVLRRAQVAALVILPVLDEAHDDDWSGGVEEECGVGLARAVKEESCIRRVGRKGEREFRCPSVGPTGIGRGGENLLGQHI